jgi:pimeloyl-ACP methyl ester carboxylesterase
MSELQEISGAGHWLHAENPQDFSQIVLSFLK